MDLIVSAENYIRNGFAVLPITRQKRPVLSSWLQYQTTLPELDDIARYFDDAYGLAVIAGRVSGNLECLDIDCKYDTTGEMFKEFCELVKECRDGLLQKMTVAKTMNGGYHFLYRVDDSHVEGNKALARRPATEQERIAGDKVKVLFETRGEGGYFAVEPTPGYATRRGGFDRLETLTAEERDILFSCARSFDQMPVEQFEQEKEQVKRTASDKELSPFDDYNSRADVADLLRRHGWKQVYHRGNRIHFKRPGTTDSAVSANFDTKRRVFYVFTTSTEFDAGRGYNPTQVYAILEHGGDYSQASKDLFSQGYGKRAAKIKVEYVERRKQSSPLYEWYQEYKRVNGGK